MYSYSLKSLPFTDELSFETIDILKQTAEAHRFLAELKGISTTLPNERMLISSLSIQEAKDSSAIENIITTHDSLFKTDVLDNKHIDLAAKEIKNYQNALWTTHHNVKNSQLIRLDNILEAQAIIEPNKSGLRKIPGTVISNAKTGETIYTPPQHPDEIQHLLANLMDYINDEELSSLDPLIKMAIIHHQFESIHPFYDGNGRTGRLLNIIYLMNNDLLTLPILYLSRYIVETKEEYYRLLQVTREANDWQAWISYILRGITETAKRTIEFVNEIRELIQTTKHRMREQLPKIYSQEMLNLMFYHPYTKVQFIIDSLGVSRITATKYLETLTQHKFLTKHKQGRTNYFVNDSLVALISKQEDYSKPETRT